MAKIKNAPDTGDLEPRDYTDFNSWIDFWESKKNKYALYYEDKKLYKCAKCGNFFAWANFDGAHILKVGSSDQKLYIYPTCKSCNEGRDETPFEANESLFVPMPDKKK